MMIQVLYAVNLNFDTYSNAMYVTRVTERKIADRPQPMYVMKVRISTWVGETVAFLDKS